MDYDMTKTVPGEVSDPGYIIKASAIYLPVKTEFNYIEEDGLSLGYPGDDGWFTTIRYTQMLGVLADDLVEMIEDRKILKRMLRQQAPGMGLISAYFITLSCEPPDIPEGKHFRVDLSDHQYIIRVNAILYYASYTASDSTWYWDILKADESQFYEDGEQALDALERDLRDQASSRERVSELDREIGQGLKVLKTAALQS